MTRLICLTLLAALLLTTLVACAGGTTTTSAATSAAGTTKTGTTTAQATTAKKQTVTLKLFYSSPSLYPDWKFGDDPITKALVEETGVTLDIKYASNSDNQELYTLLASGQNLPDLMYVGKYDPMFVNEKFVQPLNKLADKYFPLFYKNLPTNYADVHTLDDGNIYYLNSMYADTEKLASLAGGKKGVSSISVNIDEYEKLGKPAIDTLAGVKAAAAKAKADGIGYPIFLTFFGPTNNLSYGQVLNVCYGGPGFVYPQADGTVTFNCKSDQYKKGLAFLNDCYRSGLIQADNFTFNMTTKDENVKKIATTGNAFVCVGQEWVMRQFRASSGVGGTASAYLFRTQDVPIGEGVDRKAVKMDDFNASQIGGAGGWYIMSNTKYPGEAITLLSTLASEKWQTLLFHGQEGVMYTLDKSIKDGSPAGYKVMTDAYTKDSSTLSASQMIVKYGAMNSILATLRTRNVQVMFDRPFYGIGKINGTDTMLGDFMVNLGTMYATPFKTGSLTVNITATDDKLLYDNVIKAWNDGESSLVLAKSAAEFEAAYSKLIADMNKVGLANLEKILTTRYNKYNAILKETRNK